MINSYEFGNIIIDGTKYNHDVIVYKDTVTQWQRKDGHYVAIHDLKSIPEGIEIFVMGNGHSGVCVFPKETKEFIEKKGIKVVVEITGKAYKIYNKMAEQGKNVCGAFHLTC